MNLTDYKKSVIDQLVDLKQQVAKNTNYKVMLNLRDTLIQKGMESEFAEIVATKSQCVIAADLQADAEFMKSVIDAYADVVMEIYSFAQGALVDKKNFFNLIEGMNFTLEL